MRKVLKVHIEATFTGVEPVEPAAGSARGNSRLRTAARRLRAVALLAGASAIAIPAPSFANPTAAANAANFNQTTAGAFAATVPDGVCAVATTTRGGAGASAGVSAANSGIGGAGAVINARFNVLPGQAVTGAVAGGGQTTTSLTAPNNGTGTAAGGSSGASGTPPVHRGGGGGGSSSISIGGVKMVEAGGGGGGGASHSTLATTANGGGAGFLGIAPGVVTPGLNGLNGVDGATTVNGGRGGGTAAGGAGGTGAGTLSGLSGGGIGTGTGGNGGPNDANTDTGGGGGGGYTGGGGGASTTNSNVTAAGGGGGSSFVRLNSPTATAQTPSSVSGSAGPTPAAGGVPGADGLVTIDWIPCQYTLNITKAVSAASVNAGDRAIWTITVRNAGPDPMVRGDVITLTDTLPTGAAGVMGAPTPQFKVLSIGVSGGSNADMASDAITCTDSTGTLTVGEVMPASTVCSRPYATLAGVAGTPSGGSARGLNFNETLTITYEQVFANTSPAAGPLTNTATVTDRSTLTTGSDITGTNATRTSSASVSVVPYNLTISKTASAANLPAGGTITWTVTVANAGPGNMYGPYDTTTNNLSIADTAPTANAAAPTGFTSTGPLTGCTYASNVISCPGSLNASQSQTFTFDQVINSPVAAGTVITNNAAVTDYAVGDAADNSSASVTISPSANLSVVKTDGKTSTFSGSTNTYTITVRNNGPDTVTGAVVRDVPGAGITCPAGNPVTITGSGVPGGSFTIANLTGAGITLGTLTNGQSALLTFSCTVN